MSDGGKTAAADAKTAVAGHNGENGGTEKNGSMLTEMNVEDGRWKPENEKKSQINNNRSEFHSKSGDDDDDDDSNRTPTRYEKCVEKIQTAIGQMFARWKRHLLVAVVSLVVVLYHAYFFYALSYNFKKTVALLVFTVMAWTYALYCFVYEPYMAERLNAHLYQPAGAAWSQLWRKPFVKWGIYGVILAVVVAYIGYDTAADPYRLTSLAGLAVYILIGFIFSTNPARIKWRPVIWSLGFQLVLALLILRWSVGQTAFRFAADQIVRFLDYTIEGSSFVYGFLVLPPNICGMSPVFFFSVLQVLVFFGAVVSVLYYYGIIQWIILKLAKIMQFTFQTTAVESLYVASCVFLGQTEATLLIRPYLAKLTVSEWHQLWTSGFACIAGSLFAAYKSFGACPEHLLAASILSAPAAITASKLLLPETEKSQTKHIQDLELPKSTEANVLQALSNGACSVIEMIAMIGTNLIAFLATIALLNNVVWWLGDMVGIEDLTFEKIYSYLFFPLAFMMGASDNPNWHEKIDETMRVAELIGTKTILNEFIAYKKMGDYVAAGLLSGRAQMIATYALCGFSNIGSIGIQLASFASMCPERKDLFPKIAIRSLVAGSMACFITACFAGLLVSDVGKCYPSTFGANCTQIL